MSGFSSLTGGSGGLSASSSAKSGNTGASSVGIQIGGINTGQQNTVPQWMYLAAAAVALAALYLFRRR
jgi:hypothetical protein